MERQRELPGAPPCCGPLEAGHDLPGAGCAGLGAYHLCSDNPVCQWSGTTACPVPPPPTSCCYALDPSNDLTPFACATMPDKIECEDSAGHGVCKWQGTNPFCQGGSGNTACCTATNPNIDYQPGGCWSFLGFAECTGAGANYCQWSSAPTCPEPPPPPACCAPVDVGQDDPQTSCAQRTAHADCTGSTYCQWNQSAACPVPQPPAPCCAPIDISNDASGPPCAQRLTNADCRASTLCLWNAGPSCPVPPPLTCCSAKDPTYDLPGSGCASLVYADCTAPLASIYCQYNAGPNCQPPASCCTPINPNADYQPGGCAAMPDYPECELSAGAGVCQWNASATCNACPFPICVDNLSTTPPGICGGSTEAACNAAAPNCAFGCWYLPDLCCATGLGNPYACAVLPEAQCTAGNGCAFSSIGHCP